jgi:hypothetical protein
MTNTSTTVKINNEWHVITLSENGVVSSRNKKDALGAFSEVVGVVKEVMIRGRRASVATTPIGETAFFSGRESEKTAVQAVAKQWFDDNYENVSERFSICPVAKKVFETITG